jgi:hypothetical protein
MHARVTTVSGSADNVDAGIENFRTTVLPFVRESGKGAILLVDREQGEAVSITFWEDEEALGASEERANALRADVADQMGSADAPTIGRYEVAVYEP